MVRWPEIPSAINYIVIGVKNELQTNDIGRKDEYFSDALC